MDEFPNASALTGRLVAENAPNDDLSGMSLNMPAGELSGGLLNLSDGEPPGNLLNASEGDLSESSLNRDASQGVKSEIMKTVTVSFDENGYNILVQRYKELRNSGTNPNESRRVDPPEDLPYDIEGYITTIDTDEINAEYMNSRFEKFKKALDSGNPEEVRGTKEELHKTFAMLSQEEQKYANLFLHDIDNGDVELEDSKTLRDYINDYMRRVKNDQIHQFAETLGLDEDLLREMMSLKMDDVTMNEYGRFDKLKATVDRAKARECLEAIEGDKISIPKLNARIDTLIRRFILLGGFTMSAE